MKESKKLKIKNIELNELNIIISTDDYNYDYDFSDEELDELDQEIINNIKGEI